MKHLLTFFLISICVLFFPLSVMSSQSDYVLPYPSAMPGNTWYKIDLIFSQIQKYWYFGNLAQFKYNLKQSDKFLVEAKTLFEYKQYLLAHQALMKSDDYFVYASDSINKASKERKDISSVKSVFNHASVEHISVLEGLKDITPSTFIWRPEDSFPTKIMIHESLDESIGVRSSK